MEHVSENQWKSFVCNYHAETSFRQSVYQHACPVYKVVYSQTRSWSVLEKCSDELIKKLCILARIWFNLVEHQKLLVGSTTSYMHGLLNYTMQNSLEEEYDTDDSNRCEMNNYFFVCVLLVLYSNSKRKPTCYSFGKSTSLRSCLTKQHNI